MSTNPFATLREDGTCGRSFRSGSGRYYDCGRAAGHTGGHSAFADQPVCPSEPTEGQRHAAEFTRQAERIGRLIDAKPGSPLVTQIAAALERADAEAEARGHARGVAEAAALRERVEAIVAELSPHPDLRFSGWSIIGRLQRVVDGDA